MLNNDYYIIVFLLGYIANPIVSIIKKIVCNVADELIKQKKTLK